MTQSTENNLFELLKLREPKLSKLMGNIAIDSSEVIELIAQHKPNTETRRQLLDVVKPYWETLELSKAARKAIERLEDSETHIVITGQQPAMWGGPFLLSSKALSIITLTTRLQNAGIPTVALFWVADDDHEGRKLKPGRFVNGKHCENPYVEERRPIYDIRYSQLPQERLAAFSDAIGDAPYVHEAIRIASSSIASSPSEEYFSLLSKLLPEDPLLPIFPRWLRTLQRPIVNRVVEQTHQFRELVAEACREQQSIGIPTPVPIPRKEPIFIIDKDGFRKRPCEINQPVAEIIEQNHLSVSPDALLRTIVQDEVLDPSAVILGPTEFCYTLQTSKVRQQWSLSQPLWLPRPRLRPINQDLIDSLITLGVPPCKLVLNLDFTSWICDPKVKKEAKEIKIEGNHLIHRIEKLNNRNDASPALQRRVRRLVRTWRKQLEQLQNAIEQGLGVGVEERRHDISKKLERVFPGGLEPERTRNILDLIAHHGIGVLKLMRTAIQQATEKWDGTIHNFPLNSEQQVIEKRTREEG